MTKSMKPRKRIKQISPIPEGYRVLTPVYLSDGTVQMECGLTEAVGYCLALVEGEYCDYVAPYEIGPDGIGVIDDGMLAPVRFCKKCGKEMWPHVQLGEIRSLYYVCECGEVDSPNSYDHYQVNAKEENEHE